MLLGEISVADKGSHKTNKLKVNVSAEIKQKGMDGHEDSMFIMT
jgi:hypothetical protein